MKCRALSEGRMLPVMRRDKAPLSMLKYVDKWGIYCEIWTPGGAQVDFNLALEKEEGEKLFNSLVEVAKRTRNEEENEQ